jgi:hypothetical protein
MPVEYGQESNYAKEMRRHEATHTVFGAPGRPYVYREFPKMLYKFARVQGKGIIVDETFSVGDEDEQRRMESRGFHAKQEDAIAAIEREQTRDGILAAEREYAIQHGRHSEKAVNEVRQAEEAHGATHLPEVPRTPIKKRGRPAKPKVETVG